MDKLNAQTPTTAKQETATTGLLAVQNRFEEALRSLNKNTMSQKTIDLTKVFPHTETPEELLGQIDELKKCLDSFRPLTPSETKSLADAFDLEYTYESNRIEGNSLTLAETQVVLERGVTVSGKPLIHHLEAINHRDAIALVKRLVAEKVPLTPSVLLEINRIILKGSVHEEESGRFRTRPVRIKGGSSQKTEFKVR